MHNSILLVGQKYEKENNTKVKNKIATTDQL